LGAAALDVSAVSGADTETSMPVKATQVFLRALDIRGFSALGGFLAIKTFCHFAFNLFFIEFV
jgi:hypothetical protein